MNKKSNYVSAIVSVYKAEQYLEKFLDKLPEQTCFDRLQIVLNHNEPSAKEQQWVDNFTRAYPDKLKQIVTSPVVPQSVAWNQCIREAGGGYLAIWNVDDLRTPNSLKSQAEFLDENKEFGVAHGNFVIVNKFGSKEGQFIDHSYTLYDPEELEKSMCLGPFFMFRKELINKIGYFDEQLKVASDFDFAIRLAKATKIGMAFGILGYFLDENKGLSTRGDYIQPTERTLIEIRYGLNDKIERQFIPLVIQKKYDVKNLIFDNQKNKISDILRKYKMSKIKFLEDNLCTVNGYKFYLCIGNRSQTMVRAISTHIRRGKEWEPLVLEVLRKYSNKTKLAIDVGASIGIHTIPLAEENKLVLAFEPEQTAYEFLQKNIEANKKENIITSIKGLGSENKRVCFQSFSTTINRDITDRGSCNVDVVRGDSELEELGLPLESVGLIKIDAESYEDEVLLGLADTIKKAKPFIWLETHDDPLYKYRSREKAYEFMQKNDYKIVVEGEEFGKYNGLWGSIEK